MTHTTRGPVTRLVSVAGLALLLIGAGPLDRVAVAADPPCTRGDDSPTRLTAAVSGTTVTLRWLAPSGCTPAAYVIIAGSGPYQSDLATLQIGSGSTTLTVDGVPPGRYYIRAAAQAGSVRTSTSNEVVVGVGQACEVPTAPSALSVTATASSASFEWDAPPGSVGGYVIEAGSAPRLANLATLATVGEATTFSTPAPVGTYHVRVRAWNACGTGPASNDVIAAVAPPLSIPPVVTVNDSVTLTGTQVVVVSAATVTVRGRIELHDRSMLIIRDSVFNHFADYAGQFDLWAYDDSKVIVERSTIDASVYMSWHFFDRSTLQMAHVVNRTTLWHGLQQRATATFGHVTRAYATGAEGTTLQIDHAAESFIEMVLPPGTTVDEAFPPAIEAGGYRFPGPDDLGVRHTLTMSAVPAARWGITYTPESNITIRDTQALVVTFNIPRSYSGLTARFDGVRATHYQDRTWETGASRLRLVETTTMPWSPIVSGNNTLIITNSELADITGIFDTATVHIADSTLSQARAHGRANYTLERSHVSGDVVASDESVVTMIGGGVGGRAVREPRARMTATGTRTHHPGFQFGYISRITAAAGEVLSGTASIAAGYAGTDRYTNIVRTNRAVLPLARERTYRASFTYRILTAPSDGFDFTFVSEAAFSAGVFLPNVVLNGAAGDTGTATFTVTLAPYDDYELALAVIGTGAILVDDVRIVDVATGASVTETAETVLVVP